MQEIASELSSPKFWFISGVLGIFFSIIANLLTDVIKRSFSKSWWKTKRDLPTSKLNESKREDLEVCIGIFFTSLSALAFTFVSDSYRRIITAVWAESRIPKFREVKAIVEAFMNSTFTDLIIGSFITLLPITLGMAVQSLSASKLPASAHDISWGLISAALLAGVFSLIITQIPYLVRSL